MQMSVNSNLMLRSLVVLLLGILTFQARAQMPPASELKTYSPRDVDLSFQTRYYQAIGNFTKSGNSYDSLPSGAGYQNYQFDVAMRTLIFSRWAAFASTTFGYGQSDAAGVTRTNSAVSEATVGSDFLLSEGQISLIPEMFLTVPITKNSYSSDTVAVGEGAMAAEAKMIALMKFQTFEMAAFGGFLYRDLGLASLFPYGVLGEFNFGSVRWGAELRGYTSVGYDKTSDNETTRKIYFCRPTDVPPVTTRSIPDCSNLILG